MKIYEDLFAATEWWTSYGNHPRFVIGSMVLLYMVCHGSHQYTPNDTIYTSTMDPKGNMNGLARPQLRGGHWSRQPDIHRNDWERPTKTTGNW
jgi:hypothetical protein